MPLLLLISLGFIAFTTPAVAQPASSPGFENAAIHEIVASASADRLESDVRRLVAFGTRHSLSDTVSNTRGIGAARRWLFGEFQRISAECGGCLEVLYVSETIEGGSHPRVPTDVQIVNPVAIQRGRLHPDKYLLLTAH